MRKVNLRDVEEEERKSPQGKFHKFVKDVSIALGRERESLDLAKRHPFDLALVRIPKGKSYCPYHGHGAETEFYLVISGRGSIRDKNGTTEVSAGDAFLLGRAKRISSRTRARKISFTMSSPIIRAAAGQAAIPVIIPTAANGRFCWKVRKRRS